MSITFTMTAIELVKRAMQARRCLALGRTPTATEGDYGLERLNQMLKTLAADGAVPWAEETATATITADVAEVELSPRPASVRNVSLVESSDFYRPLFEWEGDDYATLPNPAQPGEPTVYSLREEADAVFLRVWPVPTADRTISYTYNRVLEDVGAFTSIDVPQSWIEGIELMLAWRLSAYANGNPDLPELAMMHERRLYDRARPGHYTLHAGFEHA